MVRLKHLNAQLALVAIILMPRILIAQCVRLERFHPKGVDLVHYVLKARTLLKVLPYVHHVSKVVMDQMKV